MQAGHYDTGIFRQTNYAHLFPYLARSACLLGGTTAEQNELFARLCRAYSSFSVSGFRAVD